MSRNTLNIPDETIHIEGAEYKIKLQDGELYYYSIPAHKPKIDGRWVRAPKWAQTYYDNAKAELSTGGCKNCGHDIRMIVQMGTGFCSQNCEEEYDQQALAKR